MISYECQSLPLNLARTECSPPARKEVEDLIPSAG